MIIQFKEGFEKVAISVQSARKAYSAALARAAELKKSNVVDFAKIRKLEDQARFFGEGLDKRLKPYLSKVRAQKKILKTIRKDSKSKYTAAKKIKGFDPLRSLQNKTRYGS